MPQRATNQNMQKSWMEIHVFTLCIPVKVVLVMGGGLHMGDLLHETKIPMSKMVYSDVSLLETM